MGGLCHVKNWKKVENLRSTLWILEKFKDIPNFEVKIIERLHAKIYISDSDLAIHGSANLTESALTSNIEQVNIIEEKNTINELEKYLMIFGKMELKEKQM